MNTSSREAGPTRDTDRQVSIRLRLTLWNISVVVLILFGLGVVLRYALQATLLSTVDNELEHSSRGAKDFTKRNGNAPLPPPGARSSSSSNDFHPQFLTTTGQDTADPNSVVVYYDPAGYRTVLTTGHSVYATILWKGQRIRVYSCPLQDKTGQIKWIAQFPRPLSETEGEVDRLTRLLVLLMGPSVLLSGLGGAFLTTRALRPVRMITQTAARIEAEDLSRRLVVAGKDELSELAMTFNGMLERLEESFRQREAAYARMEKAYEQQQRFTADASHELKSPLTVIEGTVSLNLSSGERTPAQYRKALETINASTIRMTRIVQDLLLLARSDAGHLALDLRPVSVYEILTLAREVVTDQDHTPHACPVILPDTNPQIFVNADPAHLVRLLVNLLENALRHTPPEGQVTLSISSDSDTALITVADTGSGIPEKDLVHIFDRFYRVDAARARAHGGTGLGLSIARSIAEAHGGSLTMTSQLGSGTQVYLRLPRISRTPPSHSG